jgi:DNA-binding NtrC family response regulator
MLEKRGHRVLPVGDGDRAVALLENPDTSIDLLLTNVVLPGSIQGIQIAQRAARLRPGLPTLYMSGYSRDTIEKAGRLEEGADYLEKPFTAENLAQKVRDGLESDERPRSR